MDSDWRNLSDTEIMALPPSYWRSLPTQERIDAMKLLTVHKYGNAVYNAPIAIVANKTNLHEQD